MRSANQSGRNSRCRTLTSYPTSRTSATTTRSRSIKAERGPTPHLPRQRALIPLQPSNCSSEPSAPVEFKLGPNSDLPIRWASLPFSTSLASHFSSECHHRPVPFRQGQTRHDPSTSPSASLITVSASRLLKRTPLPPAPVPLRPDSARPPTSRFREPHYRFSCPT